MAEKGKKVQRGVLPNAVNNLFELILGSYFEIRPRGTAAEQQEKEEEEEEEEEEEQQQQQEQGGGGGAW